MGVPSERLTFVGEANPNGGAWDRGVAYEAIRRVMKNNHGQVVVLLGRKVVGAFAFRGPAFSVEERGGALLVAIPHPSGLCRVWNDKSRWHRVRRLIFTTR